MQFSKRSWYVLFILLSLSVGCAPQPAFTPTPTKTPDAGLAQVTEQTATGAPTQIIATTAAPTIETPQITPTVETLTPTLDPALPTSTATETPPPPTPDDGLPADHYVMDRPFSNVYADYGDRTYSYGLTSGGQYRPHAGLDFRNIEGTPVLAAANSIVEFAGNDTADMFGPQLNFYGNLIVLRLTDYTYNGQAVYALYGHLSAISVQTGQTVAAKQEIGLVGGTGVAAGGAHLHFEVRIGDSRSYQSSTRNPDLWIKPYYGYGTIAGKIVDEAGNYLPEVSITIRGANRVLYTYTYAGSMNIPDAAWGENWTYGDLQEGWYTVTYKTDRTYTLDVYVRAGRTSWAEP
jgi:murein DD-endopeptidase MepM/ murein hydrolase activator NlpD